MRKWLAIIAIAALAVTALAVPASAHEDTTVEGRGLLFAVGNGTAVPEGKGVLKMLINGDVVIEDSAGDAAIVIVDRPADEATAEEESVDTTIVLEDFEGFLRIRGTGWTVQAEGSMVFYARGSGSATLEGRGVWHTRHRFGFWGSDGSALSFG